MYAIRSYYVLWQDNSSSIVQVVFYPFFDETRNNQRTVITSYSIHYTKLYEFSEAESAAGQKRFLGMNTAMLLIVLLVVCGVVVYLIRNLVSKPMAETVITSYSIHYTKLYDRSKKGNGDIALLSMAVLKKFSITVNIRKLEFFFWNTVYGCVRFHRSVPYTGRRYL